MKLKINNEIITHSSYIVFTKIQPKGAIQLLNNLRKQFEEIRNQIWAEKQHKCVNCGAESNLHLHHIVPLSLGGTNNIDNIVPLCEECHSKVHKLNMKGHKVLQAEGIAKAKAKGVYKGRKPVEITDKFKELYDDYMKRKISKTQMAKELHICRNTLNKLIKEYEANK